MKEIAVIAAMCVVGCLFMGWATVAGMRGARRAVEEERRHPPLGSAYQEGEDEAKREGHCWEPRRRSRVASRGRQIRGG
jgi:hypothetical protein